ncbi:MAG: substrate-binding domain-containing protein, partial [Lachnospiraceae bacterium]|nr:substrate-binding domain-containing protein [Lachnospiraceae bacterium]
GRDDNADAYKRKELFIKCLRERMLDYTDYQFESTDMTRFCENEAGRLLDRNPDVEAIFCVNDQVAVGLYEVMKKRNLVPGKDILVFGYDNSDTTTALIPPLASIGADSASLGQSALEQLLKKIEGRKPISVNVPTCLFARESLDYEMNRYTAKEIQNADNDFIMKLFNDCFYRYRNEIKESQAVDLRILYFDFMSKLIMNSKNRQPGDKEYEELCRRIDMFFDNNAMRYTDAARFVNCTDHIQKALADAGKIGSKNDRRNDLFTKMRNKALLCSQTRAIADARFQAEASSKVQNYLLETVPYRAIDVENMEDVYVNLHMLGLNNAALYMYEKPVIYRDRDDFAFPDKILLKCVVVGGETKLIPPNKQACPVESIHMRKEVTWADSGMIFFPVTLGVHVFGILACELSRGLVSKGEYLANQLGRVIALRI